MTPSEVAKVAESPRARRPASQRDVARPLVAGDSVYLGEGIWWRVDARLARSLNRLGTGDYLRRTG